MFSKSIALAGCIGLVAAGVIVAGAGPSRPQPGDLLTPAPVVTGDTSSRTETAVFSDGCFWGVQGLFQHVRGVTGTTAGYDGGAADTATYEQVSTGETGHAEAVKVTFDPRRVSYATLLRIYFSVAGNPTEIDQQTPDVGPQYRSMLWVRTDAQRRVAEAYVAELDRSHVFERPVATRIAADHGFYAAEGYHQDFLASHPDQPYIATWDLPKIAALHRLFPTEWRDDPVLARASEVRAAA